MSAVAGRLPRSSDASAVGLAGVALVVVGLWSVGGSVGLAAGLVVAAGWLVVPVHYAVGGGVVLLATVTTPATTLAGVAPVAVGLLWMVLAPGVGLPGGPAAAVVGAVAALVGVGLARWLAPAGTGSAALAVAVVLVGLPVASLGLDRLVAQIQGGPAG